MAKKIPANKFSSLNSSFSLYTSNNERNNNDAITPSTKPLYIKKACSL